MWMILDEITPSLNLVTVNGRLSWSRVNGTDPIHLKAKQVYVRAGELLIGNETHPFETDAEITLYGNRKEASLVMTGSFETGNKLLLNTGLVKFFGKPRDRHTRLQTSVYKDFDTATVETGLDWVTGDQLYFAPTNHQWQHSEYRTVEEYNSQTGLLKVNQPFNYYHYGDFTSSASKYNGVDIRGEVRLLSRNVRVAGSETNEEWGGNILTLDRMEFDGSVRQGTTQLDNVEVVNCGQKNTFNAAIRFEYTGAKRDSFVKNSVVHTSHAWSLYITASKSIQVESSDFIGAKAVGINLNSIQNVTLDNIFVGDVQKREWTGLD